MINHLILMNLKDPDDAAFVGAQVHSMRDRIPGLTAITGGPSEVQLASTWDLGFLMRFAGTEAVQAYQSHPVHLEVAAQIRDRIREMATCDLLASPSSSPSPTTTKN